MTKQEYMAKRNELMDNAQKLLDEGDVEGFEAIETEVNELDNKFEAHAKAQANMNALKEKGVEGEAVNMVKENGPVATTGAEAKTDKEKYLDIFTRVMMGGKVEDSEKEVFNKFNVQNAAQTVADHEVVIPETVVSGIWKEAAELYPILGDLAMTFVEGDMTILKETDAGADADWYDESTTVTDGTFAIGELNLSGCELAKAIPISWKLRKMAPDAFLSYITSLLAEKMGAALAKAVVSGKGKPGEGDAWKAQPKGVVTALEAEATTPQVVTYDTSTDDLTYDKMAEAMGLIKSTYKNGAAIYAKSTTIWGKLAVLKDNDGRPLFIPDVTSGGVGRIFGVPVKEEDSVADDNILLGNMRRGYAANVNENVTLYMEEHVKERYTDYMSYSLVDGSPLTTKAFAYIKNVTA
jgi:HK97 family phage major capsid protein